LITCTGYGATTYTGCSSIPANNAVLTNYYTSSAATSTVGGFIKIERGNANDTYTDVTAEILGYGIGTTNLGGSGICAPATFANAIVILQRLRDNGAVGGGGCNYSTDATGGKDPANWWPLALFDTREGLQRDADPGTATTGVEIGGVMYYVQVNAANLARWFRASVAPYNVLNSGLQAKTDNGGYTLYFSDRRNNRNAASQETGEYGWEDFVNPGVANGVPNNTCEIPGEDVNGNNACETYGRMSSYQGVYNTAPPGAIVPLNTASTPVTLAKRGQAQVNRPIFFRRALKLTNGNALGSDAVVASRVTGLTIVSENPVYIQGDWNAAATFLVNDLHAATAIIADAVSILSNNWNDNNSFAFPYIGPAAVPANTARPRSAQSYYRVAILGGKGPSFTKPSDVAAASVLGTDGGAHNFLRMLEGDNTTTVNYRGSMATLSYARQAVGTFKCCSGTLADGIVYSVPTRNFIFDTDFLNPALLPPNTPVFRDMNAVGFSQELRPGR
jgi:hypothetical protein